MEHLWIHFIQVAFFLIICAQTENKEKKDKPMPTLGLESLSEENSSAAAFCFHTGNPVSGLVFYRFAGFPNAKCSVIMRLSNFASCNRPIETAVMGQFSWGFFYSVDIQL